MDARVLFEPLLEAFGVPATVTRPAPDDTPIETVGIWLDVELSSLQDHVNDTPLGAPFTRREPIRVFALRKEDVPTVTRGTLIQAPERSGDAAVMWMVDGIDHADADHTRALMVRAREYDA